MRGVLFGGLIIWLLVITNFGQIPLKSQNSKAIPETGQTKTNYAVGFKTYRKLDYSRPDRPKSDFEGKSLGEFAPTDVQISIWYPTKDGKGTPMKFADYAYLSQQAEKPVEITETVKKQAIESIKFSVKIGVGKDLTDSEAQAILDLPTLGYRDAVPLAGKFPVIVSGFAHPRNSFALGELLASQGYVVITAPTLKTGSLQVNAPQIALEKHIRNIEFIMAEAHQLSNVDTNRLGVVGVNFDGMAALLFQMRNMSADAVVSLDGYEGKRGNIQTVQNSLYFNPLKLRVPYLLFLQDEKFEPNSGLTLDYTVFNALKYAERSVFVANGLNHFYYVDNPAGMNIVPPEKQAGVHFVQQTLLDFLDTYVKKAPLKTQNAVAPNLLREEKQIKAFKAVPTEEEFERIVMEEQDIAKVTRIFHEAKKENPEVILFKEGTINLFVFRFQRQNKPQIVLELLKLNAEAFPNSIMAQYKLGDWYLSSGQKELAKQFFEKSLQVLNNEANLSEARKNELKKLITDKLSAL